MIVRLVTTKYTKHTKDFILKKINSLFRVFRVVRG